MKLSQIGILQIRRYSNSETLYSLFLLQWVAFDYELKKGSKQMMITSGTVGATSLGQTRYQPLPCNDYLSSCVSVTSRRRATKAPASVHWCHRASRAEEPAVAPGRHATKKRKPKDPKLYEPQACFIGPAFRPKRKCCLCLDPSGPGRGGPEAVKVSWKLKGIGYTKPVRT
jgi:hypothetical protein